MKFLILLLFNLALSSSRFNLIENNTLVYTVVRHEPFEINFGGYIQGLKVCNISKENHDWSQRCTFISQNNKWQGWCPRVHFMGNESRSHCYEKKSLSLIKRPKMPEHLTSIHSQLFTITQLSIKIKKNIKNEQNKFSFVHMMHAFMLSVIVSVLIFCIIMVCH
jgi:hypothetical protein